MLKNKLFYIRTQLGYKTQTEFAEKLIGIKQSQYSRYERNERQPDTHVTYQIFKKVYEKHNVELKLFDVFYED